MPYAFMVCPDCAIQLTPFRLQLNWRRLDALHRHDAGDAAGAAGPVVVDHVADVLSMRGGQRPEVVRLRAIDAHELAARLDTTKKHLVRRLEDMDVLTGLDVATRAVPVEPAAP